MGLTATPNVNLSSNIGFGDDSTHTKDKFSKLSKIPVKRIGEITRRKLKKLTDLFTFNKVLMIKDNIFHIIINY